MNQCETVSLGQAEQLTGLPVEVIQALAESQRVPATPGPEGGLYVGKAALLGWCKLYARILNHVSQLSRPRFGGYSAFELAWMAQAGLLTATARRKGGTRL